MDISNSFINFGGWSIQGNTFTNPPDGLGSATWTITLSNDVSKDSARISYNNHDGIAKDLDNRPLSEVNDWPVLFIPTGSSSDTTPPILNNAAVIKKADNNYYMVLVFSEPVISTTSVLAIVTNGVLIDYESYATSGEPPAGFGSELWEILLTGAPTTSAVSIAYVNLSADDIRDYSGNYLASFTKSVINTISDITHPGLISAVVLNSAPNKLVLTFTEPVIVKEAVGGSSDIGWRLDVADDGGETTFTDEIPVGYGTNTWTVTLNKPLTAGKSAWISYHHGGMETTDFAGNDISIIDNRPIANRVGLSPDTIAPTLISAAVTGKGGDSNNEPWMILVFSEPVIMADGGEDDSGGWSISGNSFNQTTEPKIDSNVWFIPLTDAINVSSPAITISYNTSTGSAYDLSGNKLTSFTNRAVENKSSDTIKPTIISITARVGTKSMVITFSEPVFWMEQDSSDGGGGFTFTGLTWADQPTGNGTATWTIPLIETVTSGMSASLSYDATDPNAILILDFNANTMDSFTNTAVTIQ